MPELSGSTVDPSSRSPLVIASRVTKGAASNIRSGGAATETTESTMARASENSSSSNSSSSSSSSSSTPVSCKYTTACKSSPLYARIVSGSVGSILTSLLVTPLEVVKIRQQALSFEQQQTQQQQVRIPHSSSGASPSGAFGSGPGRERGGAAASPPPSGGGTVSLCRRGCGTFVLNNGLGDCLLPKSAVPYFDRNTGLLTEAARGTLTAPVEANSKGGTTFAQKPKSTAGTFKMLRRIFEREGLNGIYAGLRPTLVMAVPNTVLYFSAYDELVYRFRHDGHAIVDPTSPLIPLVAGGGARFLASGVTAPFEFLRTRQASLVGAAAVPPQPSSSGGGLIHEFRAIVQREGVGALYQGLRPTLWRDVPFSAIYWLCLEEMRLLWRDYTHASTTTPSEQAMQAFVNGAVSGMIAACFTTPFDVLKTRQQQLVQQQVAEESIQAAAATCSHDGAVVFYGGQNPSPAPAPPRSSSTFASLRHIARTEGLTALWRGNQARMLKVAPACAIMISSYELGKRILLSSD